MTPGLELLPVIAVTEFSSVLEQETNLREKFSGYLRKPYAAPTFCRTGAFSPRQPVENNSENLVALRPASPELSYQLRRLAEQEWPAVRDSLAINETSLSQRLSNWACREIRASVNHALSYRPCRDGAVDALEQKIHEFHHWSSKSSVGTI